MFEGLLRLVLLGCVWRRYTKSFDTHDSVILKNIPSAENSVLWVAVDCLSSPALHQSLPPFSGTLLNLTWIWTKVSQTFFGTFSKTLLIPTWLCTKASPPSLEPCWTWCGSAPKSPKPSPEPFVEPSPEPRWTWPSACTSAHRSYSGLKTPLAYAVGELGTEPWNIGILGKITGDSWCFHWSYILNGWENATFMEHLLESMFLAQKRFANVD